MLYDPIRGLAQIGMPHDHRNRSRDYNGLGRNLRSREVPVTNLLCNLVDWWPMVEPGGGGSNLVGTGRWTGNVLQVASTPALGLGNGNSLALVGVNGSTAWSQANSTALQFSTTLGMTACCWILLTTLPLPGSVIAYFMCRDGGGVLREWALYVDGRTGTNLIVFRVGNAGGFNPGGTISATWTPAPSTGVWYFIAGIYNPAIPQVQVMVNNVSQGTTAVSVTPSVVSTDFVIGSSAAAGATTSLAGRIQRCGYWKRALTADELTYLYNSGSGRDFPFN